MAVGYALRPRQRRYAAWIIYFAHLASLARPAGAADRSALAIAGDDEAATSTVRALLDEIGYDTLDLGPLSEGWRTQRDTAAYGTPYANDPADWGAGPGQAGVERLASLAAHAHRYRDILPAGVAGRASDPNYDPEQMAKANADE